MGKIAVKLLLERIRGKRGISHHIILEPRLVVRASCGAKSFSRDTVGVLSEKKIENYESELRIDKQDGKNSKDLSRGNGVNLS